MAEQFAARTVRKEYWAVVEGRPNPSEGLWEDWLLEERGAIDNPTKVVPQETLNARRAFARYRRENVDRLAEVLSWLRLWPETGRRHQLRAQLGARGIPIVGDRLYGARQAFAEGIALHARSLRFTHPTLFEPLTIVAELPGDWIEAGFDFEESA